jgi:hypothetical protein
MKPKWFGSVLGTPTSSTRQRTPKRKHQRGGKLQGIMMYVHKAQKMAKVVGKVRTSAKRARTVPDECLCMCTFNSRYQRDLGTSFGIAHDGRCKPTCIDGLDWYAVMQMAKGKGDSRRGTSSPRKNREAGGSAV